MSAHLRTIARRTSSRPTIEGAGVHLKRAMGFADLPRFDPFLLLDDFHATDPGLYQKGFPWHPHRGIETITYVIHGNVSHGDSLGNEGVIGPGDVQWMTAGSGIIHQEMPKGENNGLLWGFQLWANIPSDRKMTDPRYQGFVAQDIPVLQGPGGSTVRIIAGRYGSSAGPVSDVLIEPAYLDITIPPETRFNHPTVPGHTTFAYVIEGSASFHPDAAQASADDLLLFNDGNAVEISTGTQPVRFLLISGKPLNQPIAWYGPIVMNTDEELEIAFREFRDGTFIKQKI